MRYGESYRVTTWSRGVCSPCTTLRDFEIFDEEGNLYPVETEEEWDMIDEVVGAFIEDSEEE